MNTIAFIGLGIMGGPMARNLVKAGYRVIGFNRSPDPAERLAAAGGEAATSLADAVRDADVVITMVPDSPDVEGLALGEDGIYAHARQGSIHIDMSSIRPDVAARLTEAGKAAGVRVMDAPVSGGETGAIEGTLSIMVGGISMRSSPSWKRWAQQSCWLVHPAQAKRSRRPTSSSSRAPSNWSPKPSSSCGRTG